MIAVRDLKVGNAFCHVESGREVIRVVGAGNGSGPSVTVYYGQDGRPTGGAYLTLTDDLLAMYAEAMPLVLEDGEVRS